MTTAKYYTLNVDQQNAFLINSNMIYVKDTLLPLTIYGQNNTVDYGQEFQNNFSYLLQNFSSNTAMSHPVAGMLWYDTSITPPKLKLYTDNGVWKQVLIGTDSPGVVTVVCNTEVINTQSTLNAYLSDPDNPVTSAECNWYSTSAPTNSLSNSSTFSPSVPGYYYAQYTYNDAISQIKKTSAKSSVVTVLSISDHIGGSVLYGSNIVNQVLNVVVGDIDVIDPHTLSYAWYMYGTATPIATTTVGSYTPTLPGPYYVIVSYKDGVNTQTSVTSTTNTVQVDFSEYPAGIGTFWKGGYYAGKIIDGAGIYYLIVAPKNKNSAGFIGEAANKLMFQTSLSDPPIETVTNISGQDANTKIQNVDHPAANFCASIKDDYSDWYLPAIHELELLYYNFKPQGASATNVTAEYTANSEVIPAHGAYTALDPVRNASNVALFNTGGSQEFSVTTPYLSCTTEGAKVTTLSFNDGTQAAVDLTDTAMVRAVRRVYAGEASGDLLNAVPEIGDVTAHVEYNSLASANSIALTINSGGVIDRSESIAPGPAHGKITYSKATAQYEPATDWSGDDVFQYRVKNNIGWSAPKKLTITTTPGYIPPNLRVPEIKDIDIMCPHLGTITIPPSIVQAHSAITGVLVKSPAPTQGTATPGAAAISYTATIGQGGTDIIKYTATNNNGESNIASINIAITGAPITNSTIPVVDNLIYTIPKNAAGAYYPIVFLTDNNISSLGVQVINWEKRKLADGTLTDVFDSNMIAKFTGTFLGTRGIAADKSFMSGGTTPLPATNNGMPVTYIIGNNSNIKRSLTDIGFLIEPAKDWVGTVKIRYYVDSYGIGSVQYSDIKTLTIIVTESIIADTIGEPPVMNNLSANVQYNDSAAPNNTGILIPITGTANGQINTIIITAAPTLGTATVLSATNEFQYVPTLDKSGEDSFKYTATNENGTSIPKTVNISITAKGAVPDTAVPEIDAVTASVKYNSVNTSIDLVITDAHGAITGSGVGKTKPAHGTFEFNNGVVSYTPTTNFSGLDSFSYYVENNNGRSLESAIAITTETSTVVPPTPPAADIPVIGDITRSIEYNSLASDTNNIIPINIIAGKFDTVVWDNVNPPTHSTLVLAKDQHTFTIAPETNYSGVIKFNYTVLDGKVTSQPAVVTITVNPEKIPPYLYLNYASARVAEAIKLYKAGTPATPATMKLGDPCAGGIYIEDYKVGGIVYSLILNIQDRGQPAAASYYNTSTTASHPACPFGKATDVFVKATLVDDGYTNMETIYADKTANGLVASIRKSLHDVFDARLKLATSNNAPIPLNDVCYTDWYIPSQNELETIYYNFKPSTNANNTSSGGNANAIPARGNYTNAKVATNPLLPLQSTIANYKSPSGKSAFVDTVTPTKMGQFWSSTITASTAKIPAYSKTRVFTAGDVATALLTESHEFCVVRKVPVTPYTLTGTKFAGTALTVSAITNTFPKLLSDVIYTLWDSNGNKIEINKTGVFTPLFADIYYITVSYKDKYMNVQCDCGPPIAILDAPVPTKIGGAWGGGVWAGDIIINKIKYHLVLSSATAGGEFSISEKLQMSSAIADAADGFANTAKLLAVGREAAKKVKDINDTKLLKYQDWYIPAQNELEILYRHFKPTAVANSTSSGTNSNAALTTEQNAYTAKVPAITGVAGYSTTATAKALNESLGTYDATKMILFSSTWVAGNAVMVQNTQTGSQDQKTITDLSTIMRYRLIRKVKAI